MTKNLYEILSVSKTATQEEIKKSYKKLAIKNHPDKCMADDDKKEKEDLFKQINEAYAILSDVDKRRHYDNFGTYDNNPDAMNFGNVNDILSELFGNSFQMSGGMGGGQMPPGMEFFSMGPGSHSFKMFFGGQQQNPFGQEQQQQQHDMIEVTVNLTEIYSGVNKKVAYDILDKCDICLGTGAKDPNDIITCLTCNGAGTVSQQIGPLPIMIANQICPSCNGRGQTIKNNKTCSACKGQRITYYNRSFDLRIPSGVPNRHIHKMDGKGSYDPQHNRYNDILLVFVHNIDPKFKIDYNINSVSTIMDIRLDELLCGFIKNLSIYDETLPIYSQQYFNPNTITIIKGKGLPFFKRKEHGDLVITYRVIYPEENTRFKKYHNVFLTMFKKQEPKPPVNAVNVLSS
jgi:molecular chaperone DnaJ